MLLNELEHMRREKAKHEMYLAQTNDEDKKLRHSRIIQQYEMALAQFEKAM